MSSRKLTRSVIVGAAAIAVAGASYGIVSATSSSSPAAASSSTSTAGGPASGGGGSNARSGTIVSGTAANKATEAALAAYPGGVVDRVVQLGNGDYEVHTIGVNWPHHVFVNQDFQVIGAE